MVVGILHFDRARSLYAPLSLLRYERVIMIRQMLATAKRIKRDPKSKSQSTVNDFWTILLLSSPGFFSSPEQEKSEMDWKRVVSQESKETAELTCIVYALKGVEKRWRDLNKHIAELLSEDFMNPTAYVEFLFDNDNFSRSKLYFWVIGCLNEFDLSIEDNIKQWKLFRQARVSPLLKRLRSRHAPKARARDAKSGEGSQRADSPDKMREMELRQIQALDKEAAEVRQSLEDLRSHFQTQLMRVQALRDGVSCVLIIPSLYSICPSPVYRAISTADNKMLHSYSMAVLYTRVDPRPN
jgi:hypothetical protein